MKKTEKRRMKPTAFICRYGRIFLGGIIILAVVILSLSASLLTDHDPYQVTISEKLMKPGEGGHWMGTDVYGRDIWARLVYGSQSTLLVSIGSVCITVIAGTILGLLCGYYSKLEKYLMRFLEAFSTIPNLMLCLLMVAVFGSGIPNLMVAMSVQGIPGVARMIRNQVLSLREKEFIESEKAMGASDMRTIFVHILPHCSSFLLVRFSQGLSGAILSMTSLSYLGVGLDPSIPSWGGMVQDAQGVFYTNIHTVLFPTLAICIAVFGFAMLGDGVRDILDPKLK